MKQQEHLGYIPYVSQCVWYVPQVVFALDDCAYRTDPYPTLSGEIPGEHGEQGVQQIFIARDLRR